MPGAAFSGREKTKKGMRGVFFCYALPALDRNAEKNEFTEEAGTTRWYFYDLRIGTTIVEGSGRKHCRERPFYAGNTAQGFDHGR